MNRPVLYLCSAAEIGGGNRSLMTLWDGFQGRGIAPLATCPASGPMVDACKDRGIACEIMDYHQPSFKHPVAAWRAYRRWRGVLSKHNPRLVHANDMSGARSVALASRRAGAKLVCHVRFPLGDEYMSWVFRGLPSPNAFIFNSHALRTEMESRVRAACPRALQVVVHNAVDLDAFSGNDRTCPGKAVVGILANLMPVKGHGYFLEMARMLLKENKSLEFWIIGSDIHRTGYEEELREQAKQLRIAEHVVFWGHRDDVPNLLGQLQVLVCASDMETFGRSLIEAMGCELPVVATRVGGIPEVVEEGETGVLVPAANPGAMASAVERLLHDDALRDRMGRAGRARAARLFSVEGHVERILAVYNKVLLNPN
jgi:glycosyltransferase involved in cell wall biosynthesis